MNKEFTYEELTEMYSGLNKLIQSGVFGDYTTTLLDHTAQHVMNSMTKALKERNDAKNKS